MDVAYECSEITYVDKRLTVTIIVPVISLEALWSQRRYVLSEDEYRHWLFEKALANGATPAEANVMLGLLVLV